MGIGAVRGHSILTAELVGGVFAGSALWWLILCGGAYLVRDHFDFRKLTTINRATGVFVMAVGIIYLVVPTSKEDPTPIRRLVPKQLMAPTPTPPPATCRTGGHKAALIVRRAGISPGRDNPVMPCRGDAASHAQICLLSDRRVFSVTIGTAPRRRS
jgi:hypothetical protein